VIRGLNSQTANESGVHWLRISFNRKDLSQITQWLCGFYGDYDQDGYGLWSYDSRYYWPSGVSLNYDSDQYRAERVHKNRITLDCPGSACDTLTPSDLLLLIESCFTFGGKASRLDSFFDDYGRTVTPDELHDVVKSKHYSGFKKAHIKQTWDGPELDHNEVMFGRRGQNGCGKYLRVYDKNLESNGAKDCVRWEVEFSGDKAHKAFTVLAGTSGNIEAFAGICGALVGGCINFVHRTGDKNLDRLDVYEWWQIITETLGKLRIRTEQKPSTLIGVMQNIEYQYAPSLACVAVAFKSEFDFFNWFRDILDIGENRFNARQRDIVKQFAGTMGYKPKINQQVAENRYVNAMRSESEGD
jgi:hypothetical protein